MADLVSSQVLQKTLDELRNITRIDLCVTNTDGVLLVTTFPETAIDAESIRSFVLSAADSQIVQEYHYFKVYDNQNVEYILISKGSSDDAYMIGKVAVCEIQNLIIAYKERLDKNNFIQNLLLDNLLLVDVYNRAKKLRIDTDVRRVVFMVETKMEKDISAQETVKSLFASRPKDFITAVDEKSIIIVKELKDTDTFEDMNQTARMLVDMLNAVAEQYNYPVIVSTHPRTRKRIEQMGVSFHPLVQLLKPLGFSDYNKLQLSAKATLSDSGTINEESSILNFPALNLRQAHERPEGMEEAAVMMVGLTAERVLQGLAIINSQPRDEQRLLRLVADYSMPNVSEKVARIVLSYTDYVNRVIWKKY